MESKKRVESAEARSTSLESELERMKDQVECLSTEKQETIERLQADMTEVAIYDVIYNYTIYYRL